MTDGTRLGFGCASLGSRVSEAEGVAALGRALDAGIDWFDVAPSYGDGEAERILGAFLRRAGSSATICTKVGIDPPRIGSAARLIRPIARAVLAGVPRLRGAFRRHRPAPVQAPLDGARIRASTERSLARLGRDTIDVLALHDASAEDVTNDEVLRALEDLRAAGKVGRVSIASTAGPIGAGLAVSPIYDVVQIAQNPCDPGLAAIHDTLLAGRDVLKVTHSAYGASQLIGRFADALKRDRGLADAMARAEYSGAPASMAADFLTDHALASNPGGVVLLSLFAPAHLAQAMSRRAAAPRDMAVLNDIAARFLMPEANVRAG